MHQYEEENRSSESLSSNNLIKNLTKEIGSDLNGKFLLDQPRKEFHFQWANNLPEMWTEALFEALFE